MRISILRCQGVCWSAMAMLGGLAVSACGSAGVVDDDVEDVAVRDGSLGAIGVHGAALSEPARLPVAQSVITDAILAIAVAEEGKGPTEVGVSTGYPLSDYAGDITGGWCSEFASWAYWRGGCPFSDQWGSYPWMIGGSEQIREWFLEHSRFVYQTDPEWETYVPQPGDYIRYNTPGGGHSGIVRYVEGTSLYTVEGNVNDVVMLRRLRDYLTAYSDPADGIDGFGVNPCGDLGAGGAAGTGGAGGEGSGSGGADSIGGVGGSGGGEAGGAAGRGETGGLGTGGDTTGGTGAGGAETGGFGTGGFGIGGFETGGEVGTGGLATGGGSSGGILTDTGGASAGGTAPSTGGSPSGGMGTGTGGVAAPMGGSPATGGSPGAGGSVAASGGMATTGGVTASGGAADHGVSGSGGGSGGEPVSGSSAVTAPAAGDASTADDGGCACAIPLDPGGSGRGGVAALLFGLCLGRRSRRRSSAT